MNSPPIRFTAVAAPWSQLLTRKALQSRVWILVASLSIATGAHLLVGDSWWSVCVYTLAILVAVQYTIVRAAQSADASCKSLIEAAMDMVMILDSHGALMALNHVGEEQIWHTSRELCGRRFEELLLVADREPWSELLAGARAGKRGSFTLRFLRGDGAQRWMSGSVAPVASNGIARRIVVMARDVSDTMQAAEEQERMRTQLAQAQKMQTVGQLMSSVAFELNNPLTAVMTCAEDMLSDTRAPDDAEGLSIILSQTRRCRTIVRDLQSYAHKSEDEVVRQSYVAPIIDQVVRSMQPAIVKAGVNVTTRIDPRIPAVGLDALAVEQVVTTLLTNALQAAGTTGRVTVSARAADEACEISVEDSGPGIPPDVLPRIFEPFFTTKPAGEASGLGLSLALGVVKAVGGALKVCNQGTGPRAGAMFTAIVPFASARTSDLARRRADRSFADRSFADRSFADLTTGLADRPAPRVLSIESEVARRQTGKPYSLPQSRKGIDSITGGGDHP